MNNSDFPPKSHSSLEQSKAQEQSVYFYQATHPVFSLLSLSSPYQSLHHMGEKQLYLQTLCQITWSKEISHTAPRSVRELRGSALLPALSKAAKVLTGLGMTSTQS